MNKVLLLLFITTSLGCKSQEKKIVFPKNLDEAVLYFQQNWTRKQLDTFKIKDENSALADVHFGAGLWVRNNWVRNEKDTSFSNYFHNLGIYAPDDISSIVFTSLHRKLNNRKIDIDEQVAPYKKYWKKISDCEEKNKRIALGIFNKFRVGESIKIFMPVDVADNYRNAVIYNCPTAEWDFNSNTDLLIKARIIKKYFINDSSNVFFKVEIKELSNRKTQILMRSLKVGDLTDFSLVGLRIE